MEPVSQYMHSPVVSIDIETTVQDAARLMKEKKIGAVLITRDGEYVGIVTDTDFTRKVGAADLRTAATRAGDIMSSPLFSLEKDQGMVKANEMMRDRGIRHLTVTDGGRVIGILSVRDLLAYYLKMFTLLE